MSCRLNPFHDLFFTPVLLILRLNKSIDIRAILVRKDHTYLCVISSSLRCAGHREDIVVLVASSRHVILLSGLALSITVTQGLRVLLFILRTFTRNLFLRVFCVKSTSQNATEIFITNRLLNLNCWFWLILNYRWI
jgi:hypothetical protein